MNAHKLSQRDFWKAIGVGIATAVLLSIVMVAGLKTGISPLPKPLGLAFAETVLGTKLPLPVGLLFHVAWVTFFSVLYVWLYRYEMTFKHALILAVGLWLLVLVVFFPVVGWGFFGLAVSPLLIPGSAAPHLLFAIFLWGFSRMAFRQEHAARAH